MWEDDDYPKTLAALKKYVPKGMSTRWSLSVTTALFIDGRVTYRKQLKNASYWIEYDV